MSTARQTRPRARIVRAIYGKEVRETLRDRRTLFLLIAVPMIFYPLLLVVFTEVFVSQQEQIASAKGAVVLAEDTPAALANKIRGDDTLTVVTPEDLEGGLKEGSLHAVVSVPEGAANTLRDGGTLEVTVQFNSVHPLSDDVRSRIQDHLREYKKELLAQRLAARGLAETFVEPVALKDVDIAPSSRQLGSVLATFLPMLVLIFMITGAFYPAVDVTAGEKERKTIQTLITSPVRPLEIVIGKYLTVLTVATISGLMNVLSIGGIVVHNVLVAGEQAGGLDLGLEQVSAIDVAALVWTVLLLGIMFSAILMTIATLAETPKDAQNYLAPVYMICLLPVMIAQVPGIEISQATAFIPVLNLALGMKEILTHGVVWENLFLITVSSGLVTILTLVLAARLYTREELLIGRSGAKALFARGRRGGPPAQTPTIGQAIVLVTLLFLLLYYVGSGLQAANVWVGLIVTLWVLLLVPTLGSIRALKLDWRATLHLYRPPPLALVGALLLGVSSFVWVSGAVDAFHDAFLPVPEVFEEVMRTTFSPPETWSGKLGLIAVAALSPALCEEAVFRGFLLSSFRGRTKGVTAVVVTAILFGLFHLSIYRLLGTTALGLVMGFMVWHTRSIWPAVLYHFTNNATSILSPDLLPLLGVDVEAETLPLPLIAASVFLSVVGLILVGVSVRPSAKARAPASPH
jgi:sodium transport system permease protein